MRRQPSILSYFRQNAPITPRNESDEKSGKFSQSKGIPEALQSPLYLSPVCNPDPALASDGSVAPVQIQIQTPGTAGVPFVKNPSCVAPKPEPEPRHKRHRFRELDETSDEEESGSNSIRNHFRRKPRWTKRGHTGKKSKERILKDKLKHKHSEQKRREQFKIQYNLLEVGQRNSKIVLAGRSRSAKGAAQQPEYVEPRTLKDILDEAVSSHFNFSLLHDPSASLEERRNAEAYLKQKYPRLEFGGQTNENQEEGLLDCEPEFPSSPLSSSGSTSSIDLASLTMNSYTKPSPSLSPSPASSSGSAGSAERKRGETLFPGHIPWCKLKSQTLEVLTVNSHFIVFYNSLLQPKEALLAEAFHSFDLSDILDQASKARLQEAIKRIAVVSDSVTSGLEKPMDLCILEFTAGEQGRNWATGNCALVSAGLDEIEVSLLSTRWFEK